jgi:catechol 2,3-dioxygenase-like lactoylglutathione lyase family enzyme
MNRRAPTADNKQADEGRKVMANDEPRGAAHWIDHYVVGTNDLSSWSYWALNATGLPIRPMNGLTTTQRKKNTPIFCFMWWEGGSCRIGAFLQPEVYPPAKELGKDTPRCGFYIRPQDIDTHLRRLQRHNIPHTDAIRTASDGEEGTVIYFADPDGNQYEFWAPERMPEGAMEICTEEKVGRISHAVYGSRDLARTAAFFEKYCGMQPESNAKIAEGTLVLRLRAGARLVYKLVEQVDERVAGHSPWWDMHTALTVREEDFFFNYRRMWESLPEEAGPKEDLKDARDIEDAFPARTGLHRSPVGYKWKEIYQRGDEFYDWDGHAFHFYGGIPVTSDGSLALYRGKEQEEYLRELAESLKKRGQP